MDSHVPLLPSALLPAEYDRLVKLLTLHYAYPLPYPLAGAYFEELFASAVLRNSKFGGVQYPSFGSIAKTSKPLKHRITK